MTQSRIQGVVEPLSDQVYGKNGKKDGYSGNGTQPPSSAQMRPPGADHEPPAHNIRIPKSQKRKGGFNQDSARNHQRSCNDDRGYCVRQNLLEYHPQIAHAHNQTSLHEFSIAHAHEFPANQPCNRRPTDCPNGNDNAFDRWGHNRNQHDRENKGGNGLKKFCHPH